MCVCIIHIPLNSPKAYNSVVFSVYSQIGQTFTANSRTYSVKCKLLVAQQCPTLCDSMTVASQAPLSIGFSRQEYWRGCHFLLHGIFLNQGSNPGFPALQADSLPSEPPGKPIPEHIHHLKKEPCTHQCHSVFSLPPCSSWQSVICFCEFAYSGHFL